MEYLNTAKSKIRNKCISKRKELSSEQRMILSERISKKIMSSTFFQQANSILIYSAVNNEVSLDSLMSAKEKHFLFPVCLDKQNMIAVEINKDTVWLNGIYNIPEPSYHTGIGFPAEKIDLVICPCTAFDEKCNRLGMGAGMYDRYLSNCTNAHIISAAYEFQKVPDLVCDDWDIQMEAIFTEKKTYQIFKYNMG